VDILQISVLEFTDRPGCPLFHLEHYVDGQYIKYNSNSGFVEESLRLTPQVTRLDYLSAAFSVAFFLVLNVNEQKMFLFVGTY